MLVIMFYAYIVCFQGDQRTVILLSILMNHLCQPACYSVEWMSVLTVNILCVSEIQM